MAVDEGLRQRRAHHWIGMARWHINEIAKHIIILDLQRRNSGLVGIPRLQFRDDFPAIGFQASRFIQGGIPAGGNEAAISGQSW